MTMTIMIDHLTLLTCWECMFTHFIKLFLNFDKLPCGGNDPMLTDRDCRLTFQGKRRPFRLPVPV